MLQYNKNKIKNKKILKNNIKHKNKIIRIKILKQLLIWEHN